MRTKALLLAARPPHEGPFIPIHEREKWTPIVECHPKAPDVDGHIKLLVEHPDGSCSLHHYTEQISGLQVKAIVDEIDGVDNVTIFLEEA